MKEDRLGWHACYVWPIVVLITAPLMVVLFLTPLRCLRSIRFERKYARLPEDQKLTILRKRPEVSLTAIEFIVNVSIIIWLLSQLL